MLRSLLSLIFLLNVNASPFHADAGMDEFNPASLLHVDPIPTKTTEAVAPVVDAKAALLMDADSGVILYEKNGFSPMPMASLTKIMTAILILENHNMHEVVTIKNVPNESVGVRIWLNQYEKMTVRNLLVALLVRSAGDAAVALAEYHSGSVEAFVEEMNEKAKELNLDSTHFTNPVGLDGEIHYSSAFDLAILTKYALRFKEFRRIVRLPAAVISSTDGQFTHEFENTNINLGGYLNILGVKTGTTEAAGASLINLARDRRGTEVIVVLLNSPARFSESKQLLDWSFRNHKW